MQKITATLPGLVIVCGLNGLEHLFSLGAVKTCFHHIDMRKIVDKINQNGFILGKIF